MNREAEERAPRDLPTHQLEERLRRAEHLCDVLAWEGDLIRAQEQTRCRIQDEIYARSNELLVSPAACSTLLRSIVDKHHDRLVGFAQRRLERLADRFH